MISVTSNAKEIEIIIKRKGLGKETLMACSEIVSRVLTEGAERDWQTS
jgi:hypothetical protein